MEPSLDDKMTLSGAYRRAKSVNLHKVTDAMSALTRALREQRIQCYSNDIETRKSEHCWVFPKQYNPYYRKDENLKTSPPDYYRNLLIIQGLAWDIAYEKAIVNDSSTLRHEGHDEIFVYTGISQPDRTQGYSSKIAMYGISEIKISDNKQDLILERFFPGERSKDKFLPYMRNEVYEKTFARNVCCSRVNIETIFPYSINEPKRKAPGRPSSRVQGFAYLDEKFGKAPNLPNNTEMKEYMLNRFSTDFAGEPPSSSTGYSIVREWLKGQIRDSRN